jgi:hypothetical protein
MIWANKVLPTFIAASGWKPGTLPELAFVVQIDTTLCPSQTRAIRGFQSFTPSINRTVVRRPHDLRRLVTSPVAFAGLNLATAAAWLGFFYGLRHLEPAVVATLYNGIGSLVVLLVGRLGWQAANSGTSRFERFCFVGIAIALSALVVVSLTGRSGLAVTRTATQGVALAVTLIAGAAITIGHMIARWFNDAGVQSDAVQGTRFLLTLALGITMELLRGEPGTRSPIHVIPTLAVSAFSLIVIPSFLLQLGISRTTPLAANVFRALGPAFVFAMQQFDGRLRFSGATLIAVVAFYDLPL